MFFPRNIFPLALLICLAIAPLLLGIIYALLYSFGAVGVLSEGLTVNHWKATFVSGEVLSSFIYTIFLSLLSVLLCITAGLFLATKMQREINAGLLSYLIYLPMAFPAITAAFFFFQFLGASGLLSRLCFKLGLVHSVERFANLVNDQFSIGIICAQFFLSLPIFVLLFASVIQNERISQLQILATSLGASRRQVFWKITVSSVLQKSFPTIILYFIFKLGSYEIPLLLGRSSPETISVLTVRKMQKFNLMDIPQGYVVAALYALLILVLIICTFKPSKVTLNV